MKFRNRLKSPLLPSHPVQGIVGRVLAVSLLMGVVVFAETASAVTMPAGSTVWMEFQSNACGVTGSGDCLGSNQPGPNPPNGIPYSTFSRSTSVASGMAEVLPDRVRSYLSGTTGSFMYISMLDTYTVHGTATGPFDITVHLVASGAAQAVYQPVPNEYWLYNPSVNVEIGTFDPSTADPYSEQFRVQPFDDNLNSATHFIGGLQKNASPFSQSLFAETSYTRSVSVSDVFDLAYGVNSHISVGAVDLRNTAVIAFDLPQGVYLTSSLGGTFGAPVPVPAAVWLFGSGLLGLIGFARRNRNQGDFIPK